MQNIELNKQYKTLETLISKTKEFSGESIELQGHWGRYLCVLASGFVENAISHVYIDFVSNAASPHVIQYTTKSLESIQNPKAQKFINTAYNFKKEWGEEIEVYFKDNPDIKDAIDSLMQNRHLIAHGKNTGVSVSRVSQYLEKAKALIEYIERQCSNPS